MTQPDRIHLKDYILATEIGAFQSERGRDQRLRFNLTVDLRDPVSGVDDHVDRILSYDVLTEAIATALADQRYNLVETLAEKIAAEVLAHPRAARIEVTVEKLDRGPGALGVTISRDAGRVDVEQDVLPVRLILGNPGAAPDAAAVILPHAPGLPLPDAALRRVVLLALDQAAWTLSAALGLEVAETRTELDAAIRAGQPVVWAPTRLASDAPEAGQTPEALAFWLARRLKATGLDIVLPADATLPVTPEDLTLPIGRITPA
ncbi:dihydroneopterin aldolase [Paracoccus caeni]|uniref:dihydroneopterin aldolase n=2 Tax=Paracoccus caeni TaxID=657651 RepID=A0A934SAI2_9RHOB|nr:dihydroneopterin aldolase [Paracoccus caeni]